MARNRVQVVLDGVDNLSPVLGNVTNQIRDGVLQANLLTKALDVGFGLASKAANGLMGSIQSASGAQTDVIKSVGSLAETIKVPYHVAEKLNADITGGLAEYAAALPGETDSYIRLFRSISDDVAMTNKEMNNGKFNTEQYTDQVTELTAKFAALGDGLSFGQLTNSLGGLLGGQSIASLKQLEFFEKNPVFLKRLQETLGSKDMKDLTSGARIETILKALNSSLTDDTIGRLGGTFDGAVQGMKTKLLDPNVGIFGLLRDLDKNAAGQQSAFEAINAATQALIGSDGLFFALGDMLKVLGVDMGDPMQQLRDVALWATGKLKYLTSIVKRFGELFEENADFAKGWMSNNLGYAIKKLSQDVFGAIGDGVPRIVNMLSDGIVKAFQGLMFVFSNIDWSAAANAITSIAGKIDWGKLGQALVVVMGGMIAAQAPMIALSFFGPLGIAAGLLAASVVSSYASNWSSVTTGIAYSWSELGATIGAYWNVVRYSALNALMGFGISFVQGWTSLKAWLSGLWMQGVAAATGFFQWISMGWMNLQAMASGWMASIQGAISGFFQWIISGWMNLQAMVGGWMASIQAAIAAFFQGVTNGWNSLLGTASELIAGIGSTISSVFQMIQSKVQGLVSFIPGMGGGGAKGGSIPNKAGGFMPSTGLGGLLSSAMKEARAMPNSAGLMLANSSEAVLNRGQQALLAGALANRGGGGLQIGSITIQTQATDAQGIAREVMAEIASQYRAFQQSKLTAVS